MKNLNEIFNFDQEIKNDEKAYKEKLHQLNKNKDLRERKLTKLNDVLPSIQEALKPLGLGIAKVNFHKTGTGSDWRSFDELRVSISANRINKKFKFIAFNGYKASGAGKNESRLIEKAEKIEKALEEHTQIPNIMVNQFSLEYRDDTINLDEKNILIDFNL